MDFLMLGVQVQSLKRAIIVGTGGLAIVKIKRKKVKDIFKIFTD